MRSLVLSLILALAALGTLGAPPAAHAEHWESGFRPGYFPSWRGGSHFQWGGGSHYLWRGGSHYFSPGGFYGGYPGGIYSGYDYGYYRPRISVGVGLYPYSGYDYGFPAVGSYSYPGYGYASPTVILSTSSYRAAPSLADPVVTPPGQYTAAAAPADPAPARTDNTAHIKVVAPADAQVFFNGSPTRQVGEERQFVSPPLTPGQTYRYTVEARWMENDRMVDQTRTVSVAAGEATLINFTVPEAAPGPEVLPLPTVPR